MSVFDESDFEAFEQQDDALESAWLLGQLEKTKDADGGQNNSASVVNAADQRPAAPPAPADAAPPAAASAAAVDGSRNIANRHDGDTFVDIKSLLKTNASFYGASDDANEDAGFKKPLSLVESTQNPITARNDTVDILRGSGKNVANSMLGQSWTPTRVASSSSSSSSNSRRQQQQQQQQQTTTTPSLDLNVLSQHETMQQRLDRQSLQALRFTERENALLRGEQFAGREERRQAFAMVGNELRYFVEILSNNRPIDDESPTTQNRFYSIALGLRNIGVPKFAAWLFRENGVQPIDATTRVLAVLQLLYSAAGKRVCIDASAPCALSVPAIIGAGRNDDEMSVWQAINRLVHFSDNRSAFAYDHDSAAAAAAAAANREMIDADSAPIVVSERTLDQTECSLFFRLVRCLDRYWTQQTQAIPQLLNLSRIYPLVYGALREAIERDSLRQQSVVMLAHIFDNSMLPFLEFALSGALFTRQAIEAAIKCCYEKFSAFERTLVKHIVDSAAETYEIFWFSSDVVQFESRLKLLVTLQETERDKSGAIVNAALARMRANLQQCAKMNGVPIVRLIDQLQELHDRRMIDCLQPHLERDWAEWREEARREYPSSSMCDLILGCPHTRTLAWLNANTGLSEAQREMVGQNIGALQRRLADSLDASREPVHAKFVENQLAVDDTNAAHKVPLPILVCYERTCPSLPESDVDYSAVLVPGTNVFRAYGIFLYTRSPKQSPSRFALMTWLSPPFAGETVVAFTPFCQGLINHYISRSDRTSAPGYNGLKYYSKQHAKFMPIERLLGRREPAGAAGVMNRMKHCVALELRRKAGLRQVKSLKLPKPPSIGKSRDSLYLAYQVNDDTTNGVWRNYVHPGAAARLWDLGYMSAVEQCKTIIANSSAVGQQSGEQLLAQFDESLAATLWEQRSKSLDEERKGSLAILSTWRENFFDERADDDDDDDDDKDREESEPTRRGAADGDNSTLNAARQSRKRSRKVAHKRKVSGGSAKTTTTTTTTRKRARRVADFFVPSKRFALGALANDGVAPIALNKPAAKQTATTLSVATGTAVRQKASVERRRVRVSLDLAARLLKI